MLKHPRNYMKLSHCDYDKRENVIKPSDKPMLSSRAQMLAVIMYTGCDSNYAMCAAERSGD